MPSPEAMTSAPASAEIPDLRKKEKEKRGVGFVWSGGSSSVSSGFFGAASPGILGSGRVAFFLGRALGGSSTAAGRLLLSKAGSWLVLGGFGSALFGGLVGGTWVANRAAPAPGAAAANTFVPVLGDINDAIRIHRPKDTSLNSLKSAPGAQPDYGQTPPSKASPAGPAEDAAMPKPVEPTPPAPNPMDALAAQAKKAGLDMSKLSGLAGLGAGGGGMPHAPQLGQTTLSGPGNEFKLKSNFVPAKSFVKLKSITPFDNKVPMTSTKEGHQKVTSQRAMGQLKWARDSSNHGATAGTHEASRTYATDAFEQGKTVGGVMQGVGDGIVTPNPNPAPNVLNNPSGVNVTPYQNQLTNSQQNSGMSAALHVAGLAAIAAGIALIIAGMSMVPPNIGMIMAGIALVIAGVMMLMMSAAMAQQAQNQGQNINNQYGQQTQANIVNTCSQQANQQGVQPPNCNAPFQMPTNNIHQSVVEESNSTYNLGGGGPMH